MRQPLYLVEDSNHSAGRATAVWQAACQALGLELEVLHLDAPTTRALCERLDLHSYPALLQGEQILAVGVPDPDTARRILSQITEA
jgi:limonene-1,2-epoxide hydrolase